MLALSKADLVTPERAREVVAEWERRLGPGVPVLATSSATRAGLGELGALLLRLVPAAGARAEAATDAAPTVPGVGAASGGEVETLAEHMVFRPAQQGGFTVERVAPGAFAVRGASIERLLQRFDVDNEDAMAYVEGRLRRLGVIRALEAQGFEPGDELQIAGVALELDPAE